MRGYDSRRLWCMVCCVSVHVWAGGNTAVCASVPDACIHGCLWVQMHHTDM